MVTCMSQYQCKVGGSQSAQM